MTTSLLSTCKENSAFPFSDADIAHEARTLMRFLHVGEDGQACREDCKVIEKHELAASKRDASSRPVCMDARPTRPTLTYTGIAVLLSPYVYYSIRPASLASAWLCRGVPGFERGGVKLPNICSQSGDTMQLVLYMQYWWSGIKRRHVYLC